MGRRSVSFHTKPIASSAMVEAKRFYLKYTCPSAVKFNYDLTFVDEIDNSSYQTSYRSIFKDLYICYLEDTGEAEKMSLRKQLKRAEKALQRYTPEEVKEIVEGALNASIWKTRNGVLEFWTKTVMSRE